MLSNLPPPKVSEEEENNSIQNYKALSLYHRNPLEIREGVTIQYYLERTLYPCNKNEFEDYEEYAVRRYQLLPANIPMDLDKIKQNDDHQLAFLCGMFVIIANSDDEARMKYIESMVDTYVETSIMIDSISEQIYPFLGILQYLRETVEKFAKNALNLEQFDRRKNIICEQMIYSNIKDTPCPIRGQVGTLEVEMFHEPQPNCSDSLADHLTSAVIP